MKVKNETYNELLKIKMDLIRKLMLRKKELENKHKGIKKDDDYYLHEIAYQSRIDEIDNMILEIEKIMKFREDEVSGLVQR